MRRHQERTAPGPFWTRQARPALMPWEIQYRVGIVWVKFIGTHAQYDKIDVENVNEY